MKGPTWLEEAGKFVDEQFRRGGLPPEILALVEANPQRALELLVHGMLEMLVMGKVGVGELTQVIVGWLLG